MPATISANPNGTVAPNTNPPSLTGTTQTIVPTGGDQLASAVLSAAIQVQMNDIAFLKSYLLQQYYGDGSDGVCTFDGTTTSAGLVPSGFTYNMVRDINAASITITSLAQINTNGYALRAATFITNNGGIISAIGPAASGTTPGTCPGPHGMDGVLGYITLTDQKATPGALSGIGGSGQIGGSGSLSSGNSGVAIVSPMVSIYKTPPCRYGYVQPSTYDPSTSRLDFLRGGGSGGGGGGDGTNRGGAGGGGGSLLFLAAPTITLENGCTLNSVGGNGGNAPAGNCGGGSGGAGGGFFYVCKTLNLVGSTPVIYSVSGGNAGSGHGTGTNGTAGVSGNATPVAVFLP